MVIDELGQYPTHNSHDDQYGRAQHVEHNEEDVNTEINHVVRSHGLTPSFPDC